MVLINGRAFMQRKCLDLALAEREQTVSLLLREYESSDADWLWQTNAQLCFQNVSARFARAIGRTMEELEGLSLLDLIRRSCRATTRATRRALAAAEATLSAQGGFSELVVGFPVGDGDQVDRAFGAAHLQQAGPLHRLSRRRLGRDRRPPGGRPHRPYGPARRADRPAQPPAAARQSRPPRSRARAGARRANARSCWSTSTASRRSTTASATSPAIICCSRSRAASRR